MAWVKFQASDRFAAGSVKLEWDGRAFVLSIGRHGTYAGRVLLASGRMKDWRRLCAVRDTMNVLDGESAWLFCASGKLAGMVQKNLGRRSLTRAA